MRAGGSSWQSRNSGGLGCVGDMYAGGGGGAFSRRDTAQVGRVLVHGKQGVAGVYRCLLVSTGVLAGDAVVLAPGWHQQTM